MNLELPSGQDSDVESLQSACSGSDTYSSGATDRSSLSGTIVATAASIVEGTNPVLLSTLASSGMYTLYSTT